MLGSEQLQKIVIKMNNSKSSKNQLYKNLTTLIICGIFVLSFFWQISSINYLNTGMNVVLNSDIPNTENNEPPKIALTFDDGPHPQYTPKLLDGLRKRGIKVTFFVIGESAERYPDIIKQAFLDGHEIGNHTYSHVQLTCITKEKAIDEIEKTNRIISDSCGAIPRYIRPPYGSYNQRLKEETALTPVLWTVDPRDWSVLNTEKVVSHVTNRVKNGDIILLHDIFDTSVEAAFQIIDTLTEQGYEFVTIDELN